MKKYLSIFLMLLFLVGIVSPTFAVGGVVTDEVKVEIEALLEKYNEYILIKNRCVGSLESEYGNSVFYSIDIPILDWFSFDFRVFIGDPDLTAPLPQMYAGDRCVKITDERFDHHNDFKNMLFEIYTKDNAEMFYIAEFAYAYPRGDYGCINEGFSTHPLFITIDGELFSTEPFMDNVTLTKRYIDISTIDISVSSKGYVVTARGSSIFKDGAVQAADSDVKLLIVNENESLKIEYMEAISDYNKSTSSKELTDEEMLQSFINKLTAISELASSSEKVIAKFDVSFVRGYTLGWEPLYLTGNSNFRNMADLYDWAYSMFSHEIPAEPLFKASKYIDHAEYFFHQYLFYGDYDSIGINPPCFFGYGNDLYSLNQEVPQSLREFQAQLDDIKSVKTEDGFILYHYDDKYSKYNLWYIDWMDSFGDGECELKLRTRVFKYASNLTDEEKALLGIE